MVCTWLMCSAPVQVKLQVSLQHVTNSGDKSELASGGSIMAEHSFWSLPTL